MLTASLLSGPVVVIGYALGALGLAFLLARRGRRWWLRTVPIIAVVAAVLGKLAVVVVDEVWQPFPDKLPPVVTIATALAISVVGVAIAGMRRRRWPGRIVAVIAVVLVALVSGELVNLHFQQYPDVRAALGLSRPDERPFAETAGTRQLVTAPPGVPLERVWRPPDDLPRSGVISEVDIPNPKSGFSARKGLVYLPPAWLMSPRPQLPVLILLAGQPGTPRDWVDAGRLPDRMNAFAKAHGGLAPVVVIPDDLGQSLANPLCIDSRFGNVATYLTEDVPAWIRANLQVNPDPRYWAIGGLSHGGTCALQMAVTAPSVFPTFLDISGQQEPTLGDRNKTVATAFGGDEEAFRRINPLDILAHQQFPESAGVIVTGIDDNEYRPQGERVYAACKAAGMDVLYISLPGGHSWQVWGPGLEQSLPWLAKRLELTS